MKKKNLSKKNFFKRFKKKKVHFFSVFITVFTVLAVILLVKQKQETDQHASTSAPLSVDFANGQNHAYPIPKTFFGVGQLGNWQGFGRNTSVLSSIQDADITV